jgi:hypothetical protein
LNDHVLAVLLKCSFPVLRVLDGAILGVLDDSSHGLLPGPIGLDSAALEQLCKCCFGFFEGCIFGFIACGDKRLNTWIIAIRYLSRLREDLSLIAMVFVA